MDAMNFAYWLNGFAELTGDEPPTAAQWKGIKEHLALVFKKVTPAVAPGVVYKPGPDNIMQPQPQSSLHMWYNTPAGSPSPHPWKATCNADLSSLSAGHQIMPS